MNWFADLSPIICSVAVALALALTGAVAVRALVRGGTGGLGVFARLVLPATLIGLGVRLLAPWGPHVASGRDMGFIDEVLLAEPHAHTHLMRSLLAFLPHLEDGLAGLFWAQLIMGSLGCGLISWLTFQLCRRELPAQFAGLMAAVAVVLARVDAGPTAEVTLRLMLLLALILGRHYQQTRSIPALAASACAMVALGYARLETALLGGLVFIWLAADPETWKVGGRGNHGHLGMTALLCLSMFCSLFERWLLIPCAVAIAAWLLYQHRCWLVRWELVLVGAGVFLLLLPRGLEILSLDRDTASRFPVNFLFIFGRTHIFLADPGLCTPFAVLLFIVGVARYRRTEGALMRYLACVGVPLYTLYLLFSGDGSARIKLQGIGILALLPAAGLGAEALIDWLSRRWWTRRAWTTVLFGLVATGSLAIGYPALSTQTTLQQEYGFLESLGREPIEGATVIAPRPMSRETLIVIPRALQRRIGIQVQYIDPDADPEAYRAIEPGTLVYLGAGCHRFHDGMSLPRVGRTLTEVALDPSKYSRLALILAVMIDKQGAMERVFDSLDVGAWPVCERMQRELGLIPYRIQRARRSRFEGRWMPPQFEFGLYRTSRRP